VCAIIAADERTEFQKAVDHQAHPEVNDGPEVDCPRVVLRGWRQMWRQREIESISEHNGHQVLYQFGACKRHGSVDFPRRKSGRNMNQWTTVTILDPAMNLLCSPDYTVTGSPGNLLSRL